MSFCPVEFCLKNFLQHYDLTQSFNSKKFCPVSMDKLSRVDRLGHLFRTWNSTCKKRWTLICTRPKKLVKEYDKKPPNHNNKEQFTQQRI
jgi:hypothetical protein